MHFLLGCLVWGMIIVLMFFLRPKSRLHDVTMEIIGKKKKTLIVSLQIIIILGCTLPMGLSPFWNGEIPEHRNQYEVLAEAILEGRLYFDYPVDPKLAAMENPYDYEARMEIGAAHPWDHAYYNNHYYMYYGVVPVFLLFLPYRILTGQNLTTYHATQVFVTVFVIGVFALFYLLTKKFFPKMSLILYLFLSASFSIVGIWYSIGAPALYTTANTAGLCLGIWSLFFFVKAVWDTEQVSKSFFLAFWGSLLGALTFGCRPPMGLANLLVIPMLITFLHGKKIDGKCIKGLLMACMPYFIIGALLMAYNYIRFDNPFEFGQAYQLTVVDQSSYGSAFSKASLFRVLNGIVSNFISFVPFSDTFPYLSINGALVNFPIFLYAFWSLAQKNVRDELRKMGLWGIVKMLLFLPILISAVDALWAPTMYERSRMDIYWLMGILCFIVTGIYYRELSGKSRRKVSSGLACWSLATLLTCFLLWLIPLDWNYTCCFPQTLDNIKKVFSLGLF